MMETLDRLFAEARNEAPQTTLGDVQKWLAPLTLGAFLATVLTKLKLFVTLKPIMMISSVIVAVGIGTGAVLMMNASEEPKQTSSAPIQAVNPQKKTETKATESVVAPVFYQSAVASDTLPPLTRMLNEWNSEDVVSLPKIGYCLSLPQKPLPALPVIQPIPAVSAPDDYGTFNALKLSGAVEVFLYQGTTSEVRLEGDEKGKESIVIKNNKGTLEVYNDFKGNEAKIDKDAKVTIHITVVDLKKIECSGASKITTGAELKFDDLKMQVSGASELEMSLTTMNFSVNSSGASEIILVGSSDKMEIINSGATEFNAAAFKVKKADIICSGASELTVNVTDEIDLKLSGASEMKYTGSPTFTNKSVTGASDLKQIK